jgi:hypothetical protein
MRNKIEITFNDGKLHINGMLITSKKLKPEKNLKQLKDGNYYVDNKDWLGFITYHKEEKFWYISGFVNKKCIEKIKLFKEV